MCRGAAQVYEERMKTMSTYKLKTGKVGEAVVNAAKTVEETFTEKFLEKDESNPSGYSLKTDGLAEKAAAAYKKIEDAAVGGYKKIEDAAVGGYKKIEDAAVGGHKKIENAVVGNYKKIENGFVETFLEEVEDE